MPSLLGIDNGLTVTKAVVFDADGAPARRRPPPGAAVDAARRATSSATWTASGARPPRRSARRSPPAAGPRADIAAVAATAHGDGLYLLDADRRPLGPAILSLDSRAGGVVEALGAPARSPTRRSR